MVWYQNLNPEITNETDKSRVLCGGGLSKRRKMPRYTGAEMSLNLFVNHSAASQHFQLHSLILLLSSPSVWVCFTRLLALSSLWQIDFNFRSSSLGIRPKACSACTPQQCVSICVCVPQCPALLKGKITVFKVSEVSTSSRSDPDLAVIPHTWVIYNSFSMLT